MLKIQFKDLRKPAMWLVGSSLKIGSSSECDIVIEEAEVDDVHCELEIDQDDICVTNLSSNRSIFVNELPVVKSHELKAWDVIKIGDSELEIIDPLTERTDQAQQSTSSKTVIRPVISEWMIKANSAPLNGQFYQVNNGFVLGRENDADIVVPLSFISRRHAKFVIKKNKLYIEDLKSSNGTYVNNEKIKSCELRNSDELRLDEFTFTVVGPESSKDEKPRTVVRENKEVLKKTKKIKRATTSTQDKIKVASQTVFLHDITPNSRGKVYTINKNKNHLSKMLGHHLSTSEISVSARHVYLSETPKGWEVINNGASDGLLVNGRMQIRAILYNEDEIIVGGTQLKFQSEGDVAKKYFVPKAKKSTSKGFILILAIGALAGAIAYFSGLLNF